MRRYPSNPGLSYTFGPGPATPAVRWLIWTNVGAFILSLVIPSLTRFLGLLPAAVMEELWIWQPLTYMFLHGGIFHILFNMLALWMFGVELERMWGTRFFLKYYVATGLAAAITTMVLAFLPMTFGLTLYYSITIGASGAIYGLLLASALYFPDRPVLMYFLFPMPMKYFVAIIGALALWASITDTGGGVAHVAHLGGLVGGFVMLRARRVRPLVELQYRYQRWKNSRLRRKFDVHRGGQRGPWDEKIH